MADLRMLPVWLRGDRRGWLALNLVAGLIVWSVVVHQAVACAQVGWLCPEVGLVAGPGR
jgi:MFS superfamily sulfate permease-like transporter